MDSRRQKRSSSDLSQQEKNLLAASLGRLFGAEVIPIEEYKKINSENEALLKKANELKELQLTYIQVYCLYLGYQRYHGKWKPTTRMIERRMKKLLKEKLLIDTSIFPDEVSHNLDEAYKCYSNGLLIASYFMLIRTVEIAVSVLFNYKNANKKKAKAFEKFNWAKDHGLLKGFDIHLIEAVRNARNEAAHELVEPTERQLFSTFETVISLIKKIK